MKNQIIFVFMVSVLCFVSFSSSLIFSQENEPEKNIDPKLIKEILKGHSILEQATEVMSGKLSFSSSTSEKENSVESSPKRQLSFYKDHDLLRLDFTSPQEGTTILPNNKNNDITSIILSTKEYSYRYLAVPTTGSPFANVFKSKKANPAADLAYTNVFLMPIRSLYSLEALRITDLFQDRIAKIEYRNYESISKALWIHAAEHVSKTGGKSKWTVVLNPEEFYALLYYEMSVENNSINLTTETKSKIVTQKTKDGKIFAQTVTSSSLTNGKFINEQYVISVDSTSKPDENLFTEDCFKQLGRDYVVVDVLPNQKEKPGRLVKAAPSASSVQSYEVITVPDESTWPWPRIVFLFSGLILIVIAFVYKFTHRKR